MPQKYLHSVCFRPTFWWPVHWTENTAKGSGVGEQTGAVPKSKLFADQCFSGYPVIWSTLFNKFHYWWALGLFPFFCYFNIVALCILEHKAFCICASIFGLILRSRIFRLPYIKIALIYASINIVWEWQFSSPYTHQLSIKIFFYFLSICVFLQMTFHLLSSYESS